MMMEVMESLPESWRTRNEIPNIDLSLPALTDVQTSFTFTPEEDVRDDTSTNLEVHEDTEPEEYLIETSEEYKPEMQQIESKEDQPLVLVRSPTLTYTYGTPYKGVEVRERLRDLLHADTFVLDERARYDRFIRVGSSDELLNTKEGMHASLPNYVDAPFVVDISKGEGIT
ncbi:hypothetical protein Syun_030097 [Stephania yunnanensis]|uniref:Uncharacterized protein n=1 Tax=Stephania yunnanensis TaxID=152371 RepID=A0AAP0HGN6_9MAGN